MGGYLTMEIIEALNIVSEAHLYVYEKEDGSRYLKSECVDAIQFMVDSVGLVQHLAEWYRLAIQGMIMDGNVDPNQDDPFTVLAVTH